MTALAERRGSFKSHNNTFRCSIVASSHALSQRRGVAAEGRRATKSNLSLVIFDENRPTSIDRKKQFQLGRTLRL